MNHAQLAVPTFVSDQTRDPATFNAVISLEDEMFLFELEHLKGDRDRGAIFYYSQGKRIRDCVGQIVRWHFGAFDNVGSFMDFASGFGRLTRWLVQEIPPSRITVSDIYADGVKFQREQFGVHGVVSTPTPEQYPPAGPFDCIYVGSLFSHLPDATFGNWLRRLYQMLTPGGLLIFSVHDMDLTDPNVPKQSPDFNFHAASESRSLDPNQYGSTYVSEKYVREKSAWVTGDKAKVFRVPRGLNGYQDLYLLTAAPKRPIEELNFSWGVDGWLDVCRKMPDGRVKMRGWAVDTNPGTTVAEVQIIANGKVAQRCQPSIDLYFIADHFRNPKALRSGWQCFLTEGQIGPNDVLLFKVIESTGLERVIEAMSLTDMLAKFPPVGQVPVKTS